MTSPGTILLTADVTTVYVVFIIYRIKDTEILKRSLQAWLQHLQL
jgi:hypothetical protein